MNTNPTRVFQLSTLAIAAFAAAMTVKAPEANAIVYCVEGVYRAGCVARPVVAPGANDHLISPGEHSTDEHCPPLDRVFDNDHGPTADSGRVEYERWKSSRQQYNGGGEAYVGVMAQEVQTVLPAAVVRGGDDYLRVFYDQVGVRFQSYRRWVGAGARVPAGTPIEP